jgi:hypothetical protein
MGSKLMLTLAIRDSLPEGFLDIAARDLHTIMPQPTLIDLPGRKPQPLFVSILLHGNEDTGLHAIQRVLKRHEANGLPRAMTLFVGNVSAAREGVRRLDSQPDYNRVWPGTELPHTPEAKLMAQVMDAVRERQPFASIDIHNNSGRNPHYGCVNALDAATLHLARLFSRIVVYFTQPVGVQSAALSTVCPAVTVECGKIGATVGDVHAADLVDAAMHLDHFPVSLPPAGDIDVYHTVATVKIPPTVSFAFGQQGHDLELLAELDTANFSDQPAGAVWGAVRQGVIPFDVSDCTGSAVFGKYFEIRQQQLRLAKPLTPAMLTLDERAIRQDCLCYLMERYPLGN